MLETVEKKLADGDRLGIEEGLALLNTQDIHTAGGLASKRREQLHGREVYFGVTLNLNPTNICELRCPLCAFSRDETDSDAYFMELAEIRDYLFQYNDAGLTEVHIVGGLYPKASLSYMQCLLDTVREVFPGVTIQGFTAVEVAYLAELEGRSPEYVLELLREHGLDSMPGGGAEIFAPRVRKIIAPRKLPADRYLDIHRIAHGVGLTTNITMLYGHVETDAERIDHILRIRDLQDETGGVTAFVPLAFHSANTKLETTPTGGITDLRVLATARLLLDNVSHLRCLWNYLGIKMAQMGILFGADDLGSTSLNERIGSAAGARPLEDPSAALLSRAIRDLDLDPVMTDSKYSNCGALSVTPARTFPAEVVTHA